MNDDIPCRVTADLRKYEERDRLYDAADKLTNEARDSLSEKLRDGKRVGGHDLFDIIDSELNSDRYKIILEEFWSLISSEEDDALLRARAHKTRDGFIERFLDSRPELVEEEAIEMAQEADEGV